MDLLIPINNDSKIPMYEQIYIFIKAEIRKGFIKANTKLPSSRKLAKDLKVSRSTIVMAYEQLLSEGYIKSIEYKGYFVSNIEGLYDIEHKDKKEEIKKAAVEKFDIDFSPRGIDFSVFPYSIWRKLSKYTYNDDNKQMFNRGDNKGELFLRDIIRDYLHRARGVNTDTQRIIIGAGTEYLLILLSIILKKNIRVAMEKHTYKQAYRILQSIGWGIDSIAMDEAGMKIDELEASSASIAYIMPSHHYPTGIVMPISRRKEILDWAKDSDERYIIEDDFDSEFRYKGKPIPAMQGMDYADRVIYIGTFSRNIAPSIRVSFMVLPKSLMEKYEREAGFLSCSVPRTEQNILYHFISEGYFERHLNRMRSHYKNKYDVLLEESKVLKDRFDIIETNAGLHILLKSKKSIDETYFRKKAEEKGIKVYLLSDFLLREDRKQEYPTIVLGFAGLDISQIKRGIELLDRAWK